MQPRKTVVLRRACSLTALLSGGMFLAMVSAVAAPPDVPPHHWAARAVQNTLHQKILGTLPDGKFHGEKPVTRYELAVALDRFVKYIEAGRKPLHAVRSPKAVALPATTDHATKAALVDLSRQGFLPPSSPLFRGHGTENVTAQQLADALASVTIRLSDRALPPNRD